MNNIVITILLVILLILGVSSLILQLINNCKCPEKYADQYLSMKAVRKNPKCKFYNSYMKEKYGCGEDHKKSSPESKEKYVSFCKKYPPLSPSTRYEGSNEGYSENYGCGCVKCKKKRK